MALRLRESLVDDRPHGLRRPISGATDPKHPVRDALTTRRPPDSHSHADVVARPQARANGLQPVVPVLVAAHAHLQLPLGEVEFVVHDNDVVRRHLIFPRQRRHRVAGQVHVRHRRAINHITDPGVPRFHLRKPLDHPKPHVVPCIRVFVPGVAEPHNEPTGVLRCKEESHPYSLAYMTKPALAYVVAGSEATGGAGFQVDLKTFQQLGVYGVGTLSCIVAFDPANNWGHRFHPIPPTLIDEQMEAALATHPTVRTVKVGMLGTPDTIDTVARNLSSHDWDNVLVDPVLICKGQEPGAALDTDNALREKILPLATVVTPNVFESKTLSGMDSIDSVEDLEEAARKIGGLGIKYVLAKGGVELPGDEAVDVLWDGEKITRFATPKVGEQRVSGAGCTLAAAVTAELAKGTSIYDAVKTAKDLVYRGIQARVSAETPFDTVWQGA